MGGAWENSGFVFTNELGHHLAVHTIYKDFKAVAASIGRPTLRFHDLRHPNVKPETKIFLDLPTFLSH